MYFIALSPGAVQRSGFAPLHCPVVAPDDGDFRVGAGGGAERSATPEAPARANQTGGRDFPAAARIGLLVRLGLLLRLGLLHRLGAPPSTRRAPPSTRLDHRSPPGDREGAPDALGATGRNGGLQSVEGQRPPPIARDFFFRRALRC